MGIFGSIIGIGYHMFRSLQLLRLLFRTSDRWSERIMYHVINQCYKSIYIDNKTVLQCIWWENIRKNINLILSDQHAPHESSSRTKSTSFWRSLAEPINSILTSRMNFNLHVKFFSSTVGLYPGEYRYKLHVRMGEALFNCTGIH